MAYKGYGLQVKTLVFHRYIGIAILREMSSFQP